MSTLAEECERETSVKVNHVSHKPSQNGSVVILNNHTNTQNPPSLSLENQGSHVSSSATTDMHQLLVNSLFHNDPMRGETTQEHDNPAFVTDDETLNHNSHTLLDNGAYITQLNGSSLNETSIIIPEDALLNHHSGRVRLKKKEEKLALGDMGSKGKAENGHSTSVTLSNGVLLAANGKSNESEKSALKEAVPVTSPVTSEKFNSKKVLEEYFIPANTHKKFLRGEKLYLSNESELSVCGSCTWKRALISALVLALLAGAILLGALAATGFFTTPSEDLTLESPSGPAPVSQPREGFPPPTITPPTSFNPPTTLSTEKYHSDPSHRAGMESKNPITSGFSATTTTITSSLVPIVHTPMLSGTLVVLNRNFSDALNEPGSKAFKHLASDLEKQLEDVYSDVKTLAHAKVLSFQPSNNIAVKFRLNWPKEESAFEASRLLHSHLSRNGGFLGSYLLDPLAIEIKKESSPNSSDTNVSTSTFISSPAIEETTIPSTYSVPESAQSSSVTIDVSSEGIAPVITTEKTILPILNESIQERSSNTEWQSDPIPTQDSFPISTLKTISDYNVTDSEYSSTSEHVQTSSSVNNNFSTFEMTDTSREEEPTTKSLVTTENVHSMAETETTANNIILSDSNTSVLIINLATEAWNSTTRSPLLEDLITEQTHTEADTPTEQIELATTTATENVISQFSVNLQTGLAPWNLTEEITVRNSEQSGTDSTLEPLTENPFAGETSNYSEESLLTVAPPTTTIKGNISETDLTDPVFLESIYNTSDETINISSTTELLKIWSSNTTRDSGHTFDTDSYVIEIIPTSDISSVSNETEDGVENGQTNVTLSEDNLTFPTNDNETSETSSSVMTLTTSILSAVDTEPSIISNDTDISTTSVVEINSTDENRTDDWYNSMSHNDSLHSSTTFTEIFDITEDTTSVLGYNQSSTENEKVTTDLNSFEKTIYSSNDTAGTIQNSDVLTTTNDEFSDTNENDTVDYKTPFESGINISMDEDTYTESYNFSDSILTSTSEFLNENTTETNITSLEEFSIDSEAMKENVSMEIDAVTLNMTLTPLDNNDTFMDEEALSAFNESSEMYHHTPDMDNTTITEGCPDDEFHCPGGTECLGLNKKCNGMKDCPDHSDESNCEVDCGVNFQCTNTSQCIMAALHCDGVVDCNDGSDEIGCAPTECDQHEVMCLDRSVCIKPLEICDKRYNCHDKSDERDCVDRSACVASGHFYCPDGLCLPPGLQCDGYKDCKKGEDEENCTCPESQFQCADGKCIELAYRCDGQRNCTDGSDEMECLRVDEKGAVQVYSAVTDTWNLLCVNEDMPWEEEDGHKLCQELGFSSAESVGHMAVFLSEGMLEKENAGWSLKNITLGVNATYWTTGMTHTNSCESRLVATLTCTKYECGALRGPDGKVQVWEQWPFLVTISASPSSFHNTDNPALAAANLESNTISEKNESCRAEILSPLWLVTTAGCLQRLPRHNLFARVDQLDISPNNNAFLLPNASQWRQVTRVSMHPHLSLFRSLILNDYDLALVKLDQPLGFKKMAAVCLPDAEVNPGITCFTGSLHSLQQARQQRQQHPQVQLGNSQSAQMQQDQIQEQTQQEPPGSDTLNKGPTDEGVGSTSVTTGSSVQASFLALMVQDRTSCNEDQHYRSRVGSRMFCTDSSDKLCHDEAAPLMCFSINKQWYLAGLLSYHRFCGIYKKHPSIYTNVFPMRSYIEKVIGMKMYNVTYDPSIYVLVPPGSTVSPTTVSPLVDFVNPSVNASHLESFIQNNSSFEDISNNSLGNVTMYDDSNYTGLLNESNFGQPMFDDRLNETRDQNVTRDGFHQNPDEFQEDLIPDNTTDEVPVRPGNFSMEDSHFPESKIIYNGLNETNDTSMNDSFVVNGTEKNSAVDYEIYDNVTTTNSAINYVSADNNMTTTNMMDDYSDYSTTNGNLSNENETDIPTSYLTVDDFANSTEENDLCNQTRSPTFLCLSGDRCISFASVCDGNYDCPDQSDEWQCKAVCTNRWNFSQGRLSLALPFEHIFLHIFHWTLHSRNAVRLNERTGTLELRYLIIDSRITDEIKPVLVDNWSPVCADQWQGFLSHRVCHQLGYKSSLVTSHLLMSDIARNSTLFSLQNVDARLVQGAVVRKHDRFCRSNELLSIRCSEIQCSLWSVAGDIEELSAENRSPSGRQASTSGRSLEGSSLFSNGGSNTAQDGQWPSMILLRSSVQPPCTGNVLSHKWILTAWSCILTDREKGLVNASQWEVVSSSCSSPPCSLADEQRLAEVISVVPHPGATISGCAYQDDLALVQLATPLPFGRLTNAVCLPQQPLQPHREVCFLASYQITPSASPGGTTQSSQHSTDSDGGHRLFSPGGSSLQYLPIPSMQKCSRQDNSTGSLLCSQAGITEDGKELGKGGASLMCINENHQWELHGLATPTVHLTNGEVPTECPVRSKGMYTSLFAYTQWVADTLRSY